MGANVEIYDTKLPKEATDEQLNDAYESALDHATHMRGHGGYTGTIAESDGFKIRRDLSFDNRNDIMCHVDEFADKWGPAVAVFNLENNTWAITGVFSC
jgi:hypothetical protein